MANTQGGQAPPPPFPQASILVVDDEEDNLRILGRLLEREGYSNVRATTDPEEAIERCREQLPDLVLLDLHMPKLNGFELLARLDPILGPERARPMIVLTADLAEDVKRRALRDGASDFVTKPFDGTEVMLRVRNLLHTRRLHLRLEEANASLEARVGERTAELDEARLEMLRRLAIAGEYRDDATGEHAQRVGRVAGILAEALGLPANRVELIRHAATLHDIGKIGIRDAVLLKPGKFTEDEFEAMKAHTTIGARILSGSGSPLLQVAEEIAFTHHERWDGSGYPRGLAEGDIPVTGRIAAVADVFDALTQNRPYRPAWALEDAIAEIDAQSGRHFDPDVVQAFARSVGEIARGLV